MHLCTRLFVLMSLAVSSIAFSETASDIGKRLFENICQTCHTSPGHGQTRTAPPMKAVKKHYQQQFDSTESAIKQMSAFLQQPEVSASLMPGAIERFGLMPPLGLTSEEAMAVSGHVMMTDHSRPGQQPKATPPKPVNQQLTAQEFTFIGKNHALAAKAELGQNLMRAIAEQGTANAVSFCHEQAMPLTSQVAASRGVMIERVSDQPRNPANKAQGEPLAYIQQAKQNLANDQPITPKVMPGDQGFTAYYPITTHAMCLQCHGQPGTHIHADTLDQLRTLYPDDQATGYGTGQLRGIWVISQKTTSQ